MADDLSLLFRLKAENAQAKAVMADTRAAVAQLRQSFGPQLTQTVTVANKTFTDLGENLSNFVAQRVPLVGGAIVRVTDALKGAATQSPKTEKAIAGISKSIQSIATESGKSVPQITTFLTKLIQIEGQANRDKEAVNFFGASLATKLIPQLEKTGTELAAVSAESAAAGTSIAALAGPIGIAVAVLLAEVAALAALSKGLFNVAQQTANFQGKLFDMSQQVGVSVETLSALEVLATTTGGSIETVAASLAIFQKRLEDSHDPTSKEAKLLSDLGVTARDTETAFRQTIAGLFALGEGSKQTDAALQLFGRSGRFVNAILKESRGDLDEAIKKFRDLGIVVSSEDAKAADEFNDTLATLNFQLRALTALIGREVMPVVVDAATETQRLLKQNRDAVEALGLAAKAASVLIAAPLRGALGALNSVLVFHKKELQSVVDLYRDFVQTLRELNELRITRFDPSRGFILREPRVDPNAIPPQDLTKGRLDGLALLRQAQEAFLKNLRPFNLSEIFDDSAAKAQLEKAKKAFNALLEATRDAISEREQSFQAETEDLRRQLTLRQIDFEQYIEQSKAKSQERLTAVLGHIQEERAAVKKALAQGVIDADEAAKRRRQIDEQERDVKRATEKDKQRFADETAARDRKQSQATIDVLRNTIDTQLRILSIGDDRRIASIRALADLRVRTEEDAERQILQIRLNAIEREKQRLQTEVEIAEKDTTSDPEEILKLKAALNLRIRELEEQRKQIEEEGDRDIEAGRQRDLENERRYADELEDIKGRIRDIERDTAEEVIRLMILSFARRKDIIRAQRDLELQEEEDRHRRETEIINQEKEETDERIRVLESYLKNLKIGTDAEIAEYERLKAEIDALLVKKRELEAQQDKEDDLSSTRKQRVTKEAEQEAEEADPLGRLELDIENLKEFASIIEDSIVPLGEILRNTFLQVADAIGQTVQNWVLLGETGPAVMRKILAQALASIAAEAAVNAIKELALGFATLFFNPAESAAHFTAAGLWASIGVGSALAGRAVAGDLFKRKEQDRGRDGQSGPNQINPLILARNAGPGAQQQIAPQIQPIRVQISVNDGKFAKAVTATVVDDFNNAGPIREIVSGDGNLNRG